MMSIYSGVCWVHTPCHSDHNYYPCISVQLPSLLENDLPGCDEVRMAMDLETIIMWSWRAQLCDFGNTLRGCNRLSLEMHLEAITDWVRRCTWGPWLCELGGHVYARWEIHLEALNEWIWRCTQNQWSSKIVAVLECGQSGGSRSGGRHNGSWNSIHWLTGSCGNAEKSAQHGLPRDEILAGSGRQSILQWSSMPCMQYAAYAILSVCGTRY